MILQSLSPDVVCLNAVPPVASTIKKDAAQYHDFTIYIYVEFLCMSIWFFRACSSSYSLIGACFDAQFLTKLMNVPNPFDPETGLWFMIINMCDVNIIVFKTWCIYGPLKHPCLRNGVDLPPAIIRINFSYMVRIGFLDFEKNTTKNWHGYIFYDFLRVYIYIYTVYIYIYTYSVCIYIYISKIMVWKR